MIISYNIYDLKVFTYYTMIVENQILKLKIDLKLQEKYYVLQV